MKQVVARDWAKEQMMVPLHKAKLSGKDNNKQWRWRGITQRRRGKDNRIVETVKKVIEKEG